ncbi:MAG: NADH-quinone oxidoreductase subunit J [Acidobacteriota bacterium]
MIFAITAAVAILSAIIVVTHRNPVVCALSLVVNLCCIAVFYLLLNAMFLAAIQVIVYAGAIMVLILFVIMLLNLPQMERRREPAGLLQSILGGLLGVLFLYAIGRALSGYSRGFEAMPIREGFGWTESVGRLLFTNYFYPFEVISLLLIAAMIGAIILAKRKI